MKINRFFFVLLFTPIVLPAQNASISSDVMITMSDSIQLEATITLPLGFSPVGNSPGVVLVHGYGGNKGDMSLLSTLLSFSGYASIAYSVRGQGGSGGESTTMGEREKQDLQEVIQYFRSTAGIDSNRIAVAGGSQGGIHSWMAAAYNMPGVKAVAPSLATPHFALDLIPENCVKQGLYREMTLGSVRYSTDRDRVKNFIVQDLYDSVKSYVDQRDLERYIDSIRIPVIQGLGWTDILFPVNSGIRAAANLLQRRVPIWSYYGTNGHGYDTVLDFDEASFWVYENLDWLNRWLKNDTLSGDTLPRVFYADDRPEWPHHITDKWPPDPEGILRLYINNGILSPAPPTTESSASFSLVYDSTFSSDSGWIVGYSGQRFLNAFQSTPVRFLSGPTVDTMEVTGTPAVSFHMKSNSAQFQSHIRLFDVVQSDTGDIWQLMTRGTYGVREYNPSEVIEIGYECNALSHIIPAGHRIGIEITSLDMGTGDIAYSIPYFRSTLNTVISSNLQPSYINLPLVGSGAVSSIPQYKEPCTFYLFQNYPNPFNSATNISFTFPAPSEVTLEVFDILGRRVGIIYHGLLNAGSHTIRFDGNDLPSGIYFYRMTRGKVIETRKMVLLR
ncbi:MAG: alpha/beta fold hydrolase [Bacteroidota bacterium]